MKLSCLLGEFRSIFNKSQTCIVLVHILRALKRSFLCDYLGDFSLYLLNVCMCICMLYVHLYVVCASVCEHAHVLGNISKKKKALATFLEF